PWVANSLLARMERNRVDLYLKVLAMQDEMVVAARQRQREWSRLDEERSRVADLELQRLSRIADLERARATEHHDAERARAALADEPKQVHAARVANTALKQRLNRAPVGPAASALPGGSSAAEPKALPPCAPPSSAARNALLPVLRSARRALGGAPRR
nr:hypothetical protein [Micromonospora sp. DSM 115978]